MLPEPGNLQCNTGASGTGLAACDDEVSRRMFLCGRCRAPVLICRRCDRGQIYCMGGCARDARRERQREARRRHQATPRGRAMHAERNRRYRARGARVTDQGPARERDTGLLGGSEGTAVRSKPPDGPSSGHDRCHHCGRAALAFLRLAALRPRARRGEKNQVRHGDPRPGRPP